MPGSRLGEAQPVGLSITLHEAHEAIPLVLPKAGGTSDSVRTRTRGGIGVAQPESRPHTRRGARTAPRMTITPLTILGLPLVKVAVTSDVFIVPSLSLRNIPKKIRVDGCQAWRLGARLASSGKAYSAAAPVVSPRSWVAAARKLGLSNVNVATPVDPSRERVSDTSGTTGSG